MRAPFLRQTCRTADGAAETVLSLELDGQAIRGIVTEGSRQEGVGVVFVHGWSGNRCGPHGIITFLARELAQAGIPSLRFDFRGRGESEGEGLQASLATMAEDLVRAAKRFRDRTGTDRIVYLGLCSGGNVAIGSLKRLPGAVGMVLLSVYPFSDGDAFGRDVHRTWHYAKVYAHKALSGHTWRRFLRGDVSLRAVGNVLFGHFLRRGRNRAKEEGSQSGAAGRTAKPAAAESRTGGGPAPRKHLANLRPDLPVLMVYGTADPDAPAALNYYGEYAAEHALPVEFRHIEGANHNFSSGEWKRRLALWTVEFCRDRVERT